MTSTIILSLLAAAVAAAGYFLYRHFAHPDEEGPPRSKQQRQRDKFNRQYQEVEEFRSLLEAPNKFEDGFTIRTVIGVLFISLIMTPGEMYLGLVTGGGVGAAAQWVTVILFLEVAKRSFTKLTRQEIYLLVYVAGALVVREEGAFLDLLWRQYFVRSAEANLFGIAEQLPTWWAPRPDSPALAERTFIHADWALPIGLLVLGTIVGRISWFTSGYVLFRITSDREQLPFPTAPMSALSAMALAEESGDEKETWKWPLFSVGAVLGAAFGVIYVGVPVVTGLFGTKVELIPIPFWDLTGYFGNVLPATPLGITISLGSIIGGSAMPFWAVIGSFGGVVIHTALSPILHAYGYMPRWELGMDTINTQIATGLDFWRSFGIGITIAVTLISFYQLFSTARIKRAELREQLAENSTTGTDTCMHEGCNHHAEVRGYCIKHLGRGDFNIWLCVALFCVAAFYPIILAKTLFPTLVGTGLLVTFMLIAFVYAPIMSFVSARLDGLIGREVGMPYINEAVIFLTGYRGVDIWFVPFPTRNYGGHAEGFRVVELTGMKFTSLLKAELFMLPIVFAVSLMYWTFLWRLAPIPSDAYPYAQLMWPLRAFDTALFFSSTMYNKTWRPGETLSGSDVEMWGVEGEVEVPADQTVWSPSNLQDGKWWYWRVRASTDVHIADPAKRQYGEWSEVGHFFTDFKGKYSSGDLPKTMQLPHRFADEIFTDQPQSPQLLWPAQGVVLSTPNPNFRVQVERAGLDTVEFYFEVDRLPTFDGEFLQRSSDIPLLFEALWKDLKYTRNHRDDDGDKRYEILLRDVQPGSPAQRAGLEAGDRLHAFNGEQLQLSEWADDGAALAFVDAQMHRAADSLLVQYRRGKQVYSKKIGSEIGLELGGQISLDEPVLWGPSHITMSKVETAGLVGQVGLKVKDRLVAFNGEPLLGQGQDSASVYLRLERMVRFAADSLLVSFARDGQIQSVKIPYEAGDGLGATLTKGALLGIDEELKNDIDDDGDGLIDEDLYHPLGGQKWKIMAIGTAWGLGGYALLNVLGLPIFLVWGYVQGVLGTPHGLILPIIGAFLGRYYFWPKYGKQQWRQYAMVIGVGYGVGMSLIGMFCAALAMVSKAVSSLMY
ncbi:MAG: hypothetical protein GKR89_09235 [Candidatus Latescibacteria bacterium]|nr:hypothetical protein [Candidatus Latescibacterota bacterium]